MLFDPGIGSVGAVNESPKTSLILSAIIVLVIGLLKELLSKNVKTSYWKLMTKFLAS